MNRSRDKTAREEALMFIDITRNDIEELVANQIYDKLTILLNDTRKRLGIQKGKPIAEPIRNYNRFVLEDNGEISFSSDDAIIDLGNINGKLK